MKSLYDLDACSPTLSGFFKVFFLLSGSSVLAQSLNYECFSETFPGCSAFLTLAQHCPGTVTHVALKLVQTDMCCKWNIYAKFQ